MNLPGPSWKFRPRFLYTLLVTAGLLVFALSPGTLNRKLGLIDYGVWFLDSYAILASNDAVQAGLDPDQHNPLDIFGRPHSYSDWWFVLGRLGLTRADNFVVGGSWVAAFLLSTFVVVRLRNNREAVWNACILLSPPVLLAINRANNDLVVFVLLAIAGFVLRRAAAWRLGLALGAIALATGLKFYPVVAAAVFLLVRPPRRLLAISASASLVLLLVLADIWNTLGRGVFAMPVNVYTLGAPILLKDLGWEGHGALVAGVVLLTGAAGWLAFSRRTTGLAEPEADHSGRFFFVLGSVVLVACFLTGISHAYRWIFALMIAPWLWQEARTPANPPVRRRLARLTGWLMMTALWMDGFFCLGVNLFFAPVPAGILDQWQFIWRLFTQPLIWLFMALLAGWLLELLLVTWGEVRAGLRGAR